MLTEFEPHIAEWVLVPSDDGRFELEINGTLVYSKLATMRHAEVDEIRQLVQRAVDAST